MSAPDEPNVWEPPTAPLAREHDRPSFLGFAPGWVFVVYVAALVAATVLAVAFPFQTAAFVPLFVVVGLFFVVAVAVILRAVVVLVSLIVWGVVPTSRWTYARGAAPPGEEPPTRTR
jgi:hypothetical protein